MRSSFHQYERHSGIQLDKTCVLIVYDPWGAIIMYLCTKGMFLTVSTFEGSLLCQCKAPRRPSHRCRARCGTFQFLREVASFGKLIRSGRWCNLH